MLNMDANISIIRRIVKFSGVIFFKRLDYRQVKIVLDVRAKVRSSFAREEKVRCSFRRGVKNDYLCTLYDTE